MVVKWVSRLENRHLACPNEDVLFHIMTFLPIKFIDKVFSFTCKRLFWEIRNRMHTVDFYRMREKQHFQFIFSENSPQENTHKPRILSTMKGYPQMFHDILALQYLNKSVHVSKGDARKLMRVVGLCNMFSEFKSNVKNLENLIDGKKNLEFIQTEEVLLFPNLKRGNIHYSNLSEQLKNDPKVYKTMLAYAPFGSFPSKLQSSREFVLEFVQKTQLNFHYHLFQLFNMWGGDKMIMLEILKQNGSLLVYASDELCYDDVVVRTALNGIANFSPLVRIGDLSFHERKELGQRIQHVLHHEDIARLAIQKLPGILQYLTESLQNDKNTVLDASKIDADAFQWASPRLHNDYDFVLKCVQTNPLVFEWIPEKFQDCQWIALNAIRRKGCAFQFASERLRGKMNVIKDALKTETWPNIIKHVPAHMKDDEKLAMYGFENCDTFHPSNLSARLRSNLELIKRWNQKISSSDWIHESFWTNVNDVIELLKHDPKLLPYAPPFIQKCQRVLKEMSFLPKHVQDKCDFKITLKDDRYTLTCYTKVIIFSTSSLYNYSNSCYFSA